MNFNDPFFLFFSKCKFDSRRVTWILGSSSRAIFCILSPSFFSSFSLTIPWIDMEQSQKATILVKKLKELHQEAISCPEIKFLHTSNTCLLHLPNACFTKHTTLYDIFLYVKTWLALIYGKFIRFKCFLYNFHTGQDSTGG